MKPVVALTLVLAALAVTPAVAQSTTNLVERFLRADDRPLISYRAFRHLTASTRGGKMSAAIEAWTSLDPARGFTYEITKSEGSGLIQGRVLKKALEAEKDAVESAANKTESALTPANYEFLDINPLDAGLMKVSIKPRRNHVMLINGHLVIESESADLVRVEGELSKRPSFWTRRVRVVREYDRIGGVHVPIRMTSEADVLIVGKSSFAMDYRYSEINGKTID